MKRIILALFVFFLIDGAVFTELSDGDAKLVSWEVTGIPAVLKLSPKKEFKLT